MLGGKSGREMESLYSPDSHTLAVDEQLLNQSYPKLH